MFAKLITANIEPRSVDDAARAVEEELLPAFLAHPGARHGYWMADRTSGEVLAVTCWSDLASLKKVRAKDGAERAQIAERIGLRIRAIVTLEVLASRHSDIVDKSVTRCARATWVRGVSPDLRADLPAIYREIVSAQVRSRGFCASYWLGDHERGNGLALSVWTGLPELRESDSDSKRRRRWFEQTVGCEIDRVREYEAIGVTADRSASQLTADKVQFTPKQTV
jgi:hypothetical protein